MYVNEKYSWWGTKIKGPCIRRAWDESCGLRHGRCGARGGAFCLCCWGAGGGRDGHEGKSVRKEMITGGKRRAPRLVTWIKWKGDRCLSSWGEVASFNSVTALFVPRISCQQTNDVNNLRSRRKQKLAEKHNLNPLTSTLKSHCFVSS